MYDEIFPVAAKQMREYFDISSELAFEVVLTRSDFAPANDFVLQTTLHGNFPLTKDQLIAMVLKGNPNVQTHLQALTIKMPQWGGSLDEVRELCYEYEEVLSVEESYSGDMCYAESFINSFSNMEIGPLEDKRLSWAMRIMDKASKDEMLSARLTDAIYIRPDSENALKYIKEIDGFYPEFVFELEKRLSRKNIFKEYLSHKLEGFEEVLTRDPHNVEALEVLLKSTYFEYQRTSSPEVLKLFHQYLDAAMVYGKYRPELWMSKAAIINERDTEAASKMVMFLEQGTEYSNYSSNYMTSFYNRLSEFRLNKEDQTQTNIETDVISINLAELLPVVARQK